MYALIKCLFFLKISQNCKTLFYKIFSKNLACFALKVSKTFHNCLLFNVYKSFHKSLACLFYLALKVYKTFHKCGSLGSTACLPVVDFQNCVKNVYKSRSATGGISCLLSLSKTREPWLQPCRWKDMGPHHLGGRALAHFPFSNKYGGMTLVYVTII